MLMRGQRSSRLVVVESPFGADDDDTVNANIEYARACLADCFKRGEAPFASHLLYTQPGVLDDRKPRERRKGINAGFAWGRIAGVRAVYIDRGFSRGMVDGLVEAARLEQAIDLRSLWTRAGSPEFVDLVRRALARLSDSHSTRALKVLGPPYAPD
jgi:hypothetical protein